MYTLQYVQSNFCAYLGMFSDWYKYSDCESDWSLAIHVHILYGIPEVGAVATATTDGTGFAGLETGDLCKKRAGKKNVKDLCLFGGSLTLKRRARVLISWNLKNGREKSKMLKTFILELCLCK